MISKAIQVSITKTSLNKLSLHRVECEWAESGDLIMNDGPTIPHLLFKCINPDTSTSVSNLKYQIEISTLDKFVNNVKDILDDMSSN